MQGRETPRPHVGALTGLRAVAAVWVVLFHYRADVLALVPGLRPVAPLLDAGYLGVDVFFVLSGFVLAYNYSDALARWRGDRTRAFVRNRLARVWPVHVVTLHLDLALAAVVGTLGVTDGGHRRTPDAYVANLTMTHQWFTDRPSFNGPAWSISAEWAAYLACPLLLLGLRRVRSAVAASFGVLAAYAAMLTVFALWALPNGNVPHAGMLRLATDFCAGLLLLRVYQAQPRWVGRCTVPLAVAIAAVVLLVPEVRVGYWLAPALGVLVLCVALDSGPLGKLLGSSTFRYWGEVSYSLYMTHVLLTPVLHQVLAPSSVSGSAWWLRGLVLLAYAGALAGVAVAMHRWVEVPARRRLRARRPDPAPADGADAEVTTRRELVGAQR
ncbi:hypothetical protein GCM10027446_03210 [Angustibacter peucedani]